MLAKINFLLSLLASGQPDEGFLILDRLRVLMNRIINKISADRNPDNKFVNTMRIVNVH